MDREGVKEECKERWIERERGRDRDGEMSRHEREIETKRQTYPEG